MRILLYIIVISLLSCKEEKWKSLWKRDRVSLYKAVKLLMNDTLQVVYGRGGYAIPDSLNLKEPYGNLAFRQTDFTYDGTYSIIFYLEKNSAGRVVNPAFVYTNNQKRIDEYEKGYTMTKKLEENWYYTYE